MYEKNWKNEEQWFAKIRSPAAPVWDHDLTWNFEDFK